MSLLLSGQLEQCLWTGGTGAECCTLCLCSILQCYTTVGLALARVTVVDRLCDTVYDTLVRPPHPIVDYNTRFSGLTAQHFTSDVTTSLTDVQAQLLSMVSMETILLGHSLNNDLRALKVCLCVCAPVLVCRCGEVGREVTSVY